MNREDFPLLKEEIIYFDNGATSLKPKCVIAKIDENVKEKDRVTLIGEKIPMTEAAKYMQTSVYEGSCMINDWVPRVLVKDGKFLEE